MSVLPAVVTPDNAKPVDERTAAYLRADAIVDSINANLPAGMHIRPIPKDYVFKKMDREVTALSLHAAFQLIGGVPALASWAASNPKEFYNVWAKLIPAEAAGTLGDVNISFHSSIPSNPLDEVRIGLDGRVFTRPDDEVPD